MNCYAFLLLGICLTIYFLSSNVTVEEYGGGRRGYYGGRGGYYGGGGRGYYGGGRGIRRGGYYGNPVYIYDDADYYQYPYWYRYIPFLNYY